MYGGRESAPNVQQIVHVSMPIYMYRTGIYTATKVNKTRVFGQFYVCFFK